MKQVSFYKYATLGLLLLNIAMLAFFFLTKPKPHIKNDSRKIAIEFLNLDKEQHQSFLNLVREHKELMTSFGAEQKSILEPKFKNLLSQSTNKIPDADFMEIERLERKKIEATYQHFQDVKKILRADQLDGFQDFVRYATEFILFDKKKKPSRPKEF